MKTINAHFTNSEFWKMEKKKRKTAYNWHDFLLYKIVGEVKKNESNRKTNSVSKK